MGQAISLVLQDDRLCAEVESAFPDFPILAEYLARRVKENNGSLAVVRFMIEGLKEAVSNPNPETLEAAIRLAVDRDVVQTAFLLDELEKTGMNVCLLSFRLIFKLMGDVRMNGQNTSEGCTRLRRTVSQNCLAEYSRIFVCALAMLKGLKVDPRAMTAAA